MKNRYQQIIRMQRVLLGDVKHEVTVRRIGKNYHCRVFTNGVVNQEAVCKEKTDIGYTCRQMLRMEDKCGNISEFAHAARFR